MLQFNILSMTKGRTQITYINGYQLSGGVKIPTKICKLESATYVCRFNNCSHKLKQLSKVGFLLIHYLTEVMDTHNNCVSNSSYHRQQFLLWVKQSCNRTFKDSAVQKGFVQLKKLDLIISFDKRSYFSVNPLHFCKCSLNDRKRMIMNLCIMYFANPKKTSNLRRAFGI